MPMVCSSNAGYQINNPNFVTYVCRLWNFESNVIGFFHKQSNVNYVFFIYNKYINIQVWHLDLVQSGSNFVKIRGLFEESLKTVIPDDAKMENS